jgi:hypothetical protein
MFTFETTDEKEVRRFRIAQFNGRVTTAKSGEAVITGHVRSVREHKLSTPARWAITIVPSEPKIKPGMLRPVSLARPFAEDYF